MSIHSILQYNLTCGGLQIVSGGWSRIRTLQTQGTKLTTELPPPNLTYPPLALSSATFYSQLKIELVKVSYPDSTPVPPHVRRHHRSPTLSPQLDLAGF